MNKLNKPLTYFLIPSIFISILLLVAPLESMGRIGNIILGMTLFAILWYTWETQELRKATVHQISLQIRPFIICKRKTTSSVVIEELELANIGNGMALNISVQENMSSKELSYKIRNIDILPAGGVAQALLTVYNSQGEEITALDHTALFLLSLFENKGMLKIKYSDIEGNVYETDILADGESFVVQEQKKLS